MVNFIRDGCGSGFTGRRPFALWMCARALAEGLDDKSRRPRPGPEPGMLEENAIGSFDIEKRSDIKTVHQRVPTIGGQEHVTYAVFAKNQDQASSERSPCRLGALSMAGKGLNRWKAEGANGQSWQLRQMRRARNWSGRKRTSTHVQDLTTAFATFPHHYLPTNQGRNCI